ncbi:amino acid ABC transporter permease [Rhodococcus sp. MEB064]|uniref:amino acid ABC transporter permease n=1 Tax=Rhodococcus sp. MEB064 TaxID=1587522 RepID=UPI0005ABEE0A|nr:amino acid ABC transporter permease [Rhodococcus sp. MEB064]KIQ08064.1 hypothetical protein RU01_21595 [Rhodococcus sp. MEB064]
MLSVLLGLPLTLVVTAGSLLLGTLLAVPLTLGLQSRYWLVWLACRAVVDIVRGVPPIVWLFVLFYGVSIGAIQLSALVAGIGALAIVAAAYLAEIFRGASKALHHGQSEAATALGLSKRTAFISVIVPQVWRAAIPGYTNYAIALLKDSSIVSIVGVSEIVDRAGQLSRSTDLGVLVFLLAGLVYVVLSILIGIGSRAADARIRARVAV